MNLTVVNTTQRSSIYRRPASEPRPKVLCIYTGGTIGMKKNAEGAFVPAPGYLKEVTSSTPNFHHSDMPLYEIYEYETLIDSSDSTPQNWLQICQDIEYNYNKYDGFVVLHGTDTLAFTGSALSFFLRNLSKHVVVTGAQIPMSELYNDGLFNFIGAIYMAGWYCIPEVTLFFGGKLMRANRVQKYSSWSLNAFDSACFPCLGEWGATISIHDEFVMYNGEFRETLAKQKSAPISAIPRVKSVEVRLGENSEDVATHPSDTIIIPRKVCNDVTMIYLYPGITGQDVLAAGASKRGVIILAYGAGNGPTSDPHFATAIKRLKQEGTIVICVTQTHWGLVDLGLYAAGLGKVGVTSGYTMTPQAAYAKLVYLLSIGCTSREEIERAMCDDIRGEIETFRSSDVRAPY